MEIPPLSPVSGDALTRRSENRNRERNGRGETQPHPRTLAALATALDCRPGDLLNDHEAVASGPVGKPEAGGARQAEAFTSSASSPLSATSAENVVASGVSASPVSVVSVFAAPPSNLSGSWRPALSR